MSDKPRITPSAVIALVIAGVVVLLALSGKVSKLFIQPTSEAPQQASSDTRRGETSRTETGRSAPTGDSSDHASTVRRFRAKLMEFEYAAKLFSGVEPGATSGVIKIQVTNFWFEFKPHEKRQLTTMITNMWQQEAGTSTVIVHIYDQTGHEVAGNSVLSGVWIDNE